MYQNIETCIKQGKEYLGFFNSDVGEKQGEHISQNLLRYNCINKKLIKCQGHIGLNFAQNTPTRPNRQNII